MYVPLTDKFRFVDLHNNTARVFYKESTRHIKKVELESYFEDYKNLCCIIDLKKNYREPLWEELQQKGFLNGMPETENKRYNFVSINVWMRKRTPESVIH